MTLATAMLFGAKSARADIVWSETGPTCPLPHSPYSYETATPASRYLDYTPVDNHAFVCSLDEDDDGIHDDVENALADCFAPYLVFDSKENAQATGIPTWPAPNGAEPIVAYTVEPTADAYEFRLAWLTMWNWDGGFEDYDGVAIVADAGANMHPGDAQTVDMRVTVAPTAAGAWTAKLVRYNPGGPTWQQSSGAVGDGQLVYSDFGEYFDAGGPFNVYTEGWRPEATVQHLELYQGTHPVLYSSAGKHHGFIHAQSEYVWTRGYEKICVNPLPVGPCGELMDNTLFHVHDRALGDGPSWLVPTMAPLAIPGSPDQTEVRHLNVGRVESPAPTSGAQQAGCRAMYDLTLVYMTACACTDSTCPPPAPAERCEALHQNIVDASTTCYAKSSLPDADTNQSFCRLRLDGVHMFGPFVSDLDMVRWGYKSSLGSSQAFCGTTAAGCDTETASLGDAIGYRGPPFIDTDGDGVENYADTCPLVAYETIDADGDGAAVECDPDDAHWDRWVGPGDATRNLRAKGTSAFSSGAEDNGWLDTDQDGDINSRDLCPFADFVTSNVNGPGEQTNFPAEQSQSYKHSGYSRRGNACDPFEVSYTRATFPNPTVLDVELCPSSDGYEVERTVEVCHEPVFGLTANDPALQPNGVADYATRAATLQQKAKFVPVTLARCACDRADVTKCKTDPQSPCNSHDGLKGNEAIALVAESGWVPLWTSDCPKDASGYRASPWWNIARPSVPFECDQPKCDSQSYGWTSTQCITWDWKAELDANSSTLHPHLPLGFDSLDDVNGKSFVSSQFPVLIGSETFSPDYAESQSNWNQTHASPYVGSTVTQNGQEPDLDIAVEGVGVGDEGWKARTRRMRSFVGKQSERLTTAHYVRVVGSPSDCPAYRHDPPTKDRRMGLVWPPDAITSRPNLTSPLGPMIEPRGWALGTFPDQAAAGGRTFALLNLATGGWAGLAVSGDTLALDTVGPTTVTVVPMAVDRESDAPPQLLAVVFAGGDRSAPRATAWAVLEPTALDATTASYALTASGAFPLDTPVGQVLADNEPGTAVLFAESNGGTARMFRFARGERGWHEVAIRDAVPFRADASYVVHDGVLFRAGGADASGALQGELLALDTRDGARYPLGATFVPRRAPAFAWDAERKGLVYGGGSDAAGVRHGDLWSIGREDGVPRQLAPDAVSPELPRLDRDALVLASGHSQRAAVWGWDDAQVTFEASSSDGTGWHRRDPRRLAVDAADDRCPDGSSPPLCQASPEWWQNPGHVACGETSCVSNGAAPLRSLVTLPVAPVTSADVDVAFVWLGIGDRIERWTTSSPPTRVASVRVGGNVRDVRVWGPTVAVSTRKGLVLVSSSSGQWKASAPVPLCGSPLDAEPTGDGRWIVATSAGVSTVGVDASGSPTLLDAALIWPNGKGELRTRAVDPERLDPACKLLDKAICLGKRCKLGRASSALAVRGSDALLVPASAALPLSWFASWLGGGGACGALAAPQTPLLWLEHGDGGWVVQSSLEVPGTVRAMRVAGDYAYLKARDGLLGLGQATTPLVELGKGTLTLAGSHSLANWVETRGSDDVRARVKDGGAQLAVLGY